MKSDSSIAFWSQILVISSLRVSDILRHVLRNIYGGSKGSSRTSMNIQSQFHTRSYIGMYKDCSGDFDGNMKKLPIQ